VHGIDFSQSGEGRFIYTPGGRLALARLTVFTVIQTGVNCSHWVATFWYHSAILSHFRRRYFHAVVKPVVMRESTSPPLAHHTINLVLMHKGVQSGKRPVSISNWLG
jgi:hypothetical protein